MTKELPKGWVRTRLGDVATPGRTRVLPRDYPDLPFVGLEHIESHTMRLLDKGHASEVRSSSILFEKHDVLYGKMRPYLNKVWVAEFAGICSAEFLVFPHIEELDSAFLAFRLNAADFVNFANQHASGDRPRVDFKSLRSFRINLPPFREQQRIASTLTEAFARMHDSELAALSGGEQLAKYRQAVLQAAVVGNLTRDWRQTHEHRETGPMLLERLLESRRAHWEERELRRISKGAKSPKDNRWKSRYEEPVRPKADALPKLARGWTWAALNQLLESMRNGIGMPPREKKGLPILRISAVRPMYVDLKDRRHLPKSVRAKFSDFALEEGDLLFTRYNGTRDLAGVCGRVPPLNETIVYPDKLIRCIVVSGYSPLDLFIEVAANCGVTREKIAASLRTTAGQWGLSGSALKEIPIPLPPLEEQKQIVLEVRSRLSAANGLAQALSRQRDLAHDMRESLLQKGLDGELTSQDPKDEPASFLLDRIRLAREPMNQTRKGKPMSKSGKKLARVPLADLLGSHAQPVTPEQLFKDAGFQPADADLFYRELASLRKNLRETKPSGSNARTWPHRGRVLLELRRK